MDVIVTLFRALANDLRLQMLKAAHDAPGIAVGELAERLGVPDFLVSQHLRILADLGLLDARPSGRRVYVHPGPAAGRRSGIVPSLARVLADVWQAANSRNLTPDQVWDFGAERDPTPPERQLRNALSFVFTAYTNLRRLLLLRRLVVKGPADRDALAEEIGMSEAAAARQLSKLQRRGLVSQSGRGGIWSLVPEPAGPVQRRLHALVMRAIAPGEPGANPIPGQV